VAQRWHTAQIRTRGWPTRTWAELVAVVMAPAKRNPSRETSRADDLAILIDSAAAVTKISMVSEPRLPID